MPKIKKVVTVTITKELEVEIDSDKLTPAALAEFSAVIYQTDDPDEMFRHVASQIAQHGGGFIEGLGRASDVATFWPVVLYNMLDEDIEAHVVVGDGAGAAS